MFISKAAILLYGVSTYGLQQWAADTTHSGWTNVAPQ